jgi:hypothetical protein
MKTLLSAILVALLTGCNLPAPNWSIADWQRQQIIEQRRSEAPTDWERYQQQQRNLIQSPLQNQGSAFDRGGMFNPIYVQPVPETQWYLQPNRISNP